MHRRKMTRFFAGLLSALLVFTSSGVEQLVYAAEVPQTVEGVAEGESVKDEQPDEEIEGDSAEEEQQEEKYEEVPGETENSDDVNDETETKGESAPTENTVTATEQNADGMIASGVVDKSYGHVEWSIDADGKLFVNGIGDISDPDYNIYSGRMPWREYRDKIKIAEIVLTGCTNISYMFENCTNLTKVDLSKLDTKEVVNMTSMFL